MKKNKILLPLFALPLLLLFYSETAAAASSSAPAIRLDWNAVEPEFVTPGVYARARKIPSGGLVLAYSHDGSIYVRTKTDSSWSAAKCVAVAPGKKPTGYYYTNAEITVLADGRFFCTWNARPRIKEKKLPFKIMASVSSDSGATWGNPIDLYTAGKTRRTGCWEPVTIQLPDGEVQVWFANEAKTPEGAQNITVLRSRDGGATWLPPAVASYRPRCRDGMPVPVLLSDGTLVCAIEDNGIDGPALKPVIVQPYPDLSRPVGAKGPRRWHALHADCRMSTRTHAGAPYLICLNTGETVLSFQFREEGAPKTAPRMLLVHVGDKHARDFASPSTPPLPENGSTQWNSLCQVDDDTLIAVSSISGLSEKNGIWISTAKIIRGKKESSQRK